MNIHDLDLTILVNRFSNLGATLCATEDGFRDATTGIAVGDGKLLWRIELDQDLAANLTAAFRQALETLTTPTDDHDSIPTIGIWLDHYAPDGPCYLLETGRVFIPSHLDDAIAYAVQHEQRYIYDIDRGLEIAVVPAVITID